MKTSELIKQRLIAANQRFFANDNISKYISSDELASLKEELTNSFSLVLDSLVIDQENDPNSNETAARLAKMYLTEIMSGRYNAAPKVTAFPNNGTDAYDGLLVIRSELKSICSHHHQPVTGVAYIGIIPGTDGKLPGLSKYSRIAQWCARRGTLQEELCNMIANKISEVSECNNIGVHIGAEHGCCTHRGIMSHSSLTQTTVLLGSFKSDPSVKQEFFDNIKLQQSAGGAGAY